MSEPIGIGILAGSAIVNSIASMDKANTDAANYNADADAYRFNAQQERLAAEQAYQEGSLNASMTRLQGRENIAAGTAAMSAMGNVGTSAQAAIREGAFNLDKDLSAIRYKYYSEATQHKNLAAMYEYNAKVAEKNAKDAKISGFLGGVSALMGGAIKGYDLGFFGGKD